MGDLGVPQTQDTALELLGYFPGRLVVKTSLAGGVGSIPSVGAKISHALHQINK